MTDVPGVMRDKDDASTKFAALTIRKCKELQDEGIIAGGMIPKVRPCGVQLQGGGVLCSVAATLGGWALFPCSSSGWMLSCVKMRALPSGPADPPTPLLLPVAVPPRPPHPVGGLLHSVAVAGRQRDAHHRRPPGALAADGAADG